VTGKAKEKGIDLSTIHRGTGAGGGATGAKYKFNAFSLKNGGVGSAGSSRDNKRKREDGDDEDREGKKEKKVSSAYFQGLSVEIVLIVVIFLSDPPPTACLPLHRIPRQEARCRPCSWYLGRRRRARLSPTDRLEV
jgi:hypothetical protein